MFRCVGKASFQDGDQVAVVVYMSCLDLLSCFQLPVSEVGRGAGYLLAEHQ